MRIRKGDIYYADLSPTVGSEQFGLRPVLIIQNNIGNKYSPTTIIAPLTTKHKTHMPTHVDIELQPLPAKSVVMLEQIRCIDRRRLCEYVGKVDKLLMIQVEKVIITSFGINIYEHYVDTKELENYITEKMNEVIDLYFADEKLRGYERDMKVIPNSGRREVWETKENCSECVKHDFSFRACVECKCPYIARKMEEYSVTTKHLMETLMTRITYIPFNIRVKEVLSHFYGNKLYINSTHLVLFRNALTRSEVKKNDYARIAAMYVLTMVPDAWSKMIWTFKGFICQRSSRNNKEKAIMRFANQLFDGKTKPDLSAVSDKSLFSDDEFICLCNALMISRYGTSVIKLKMVDRQETKSYKVIK